MTSSTPRTARKAGKLLFLLGLLAFTGAALLPVGLGLQPRKLKESRSSTRLSYWAEYWKEARTAGPLELGADLLPSMVPGPLDSWGGHSSHSLSVAFEVDPGKYEVQLFFYDVHDSAPPRVTFDLNGSPLGERRLSRGSGKPGPYRRVKTDLTVEIDLTATGGRDILTITTDDGSWFAPAGLWLSAGTSFLPARSVYLLAERGTLLLFWCALLLAGIFFLAASRQGAGNAASAVALLAFSAALALFAAEAAFRYFLSQHPDQRNLPVAEHREKETTEEGRHYTYVTMIEPADDYEILYQLKPGLKGFFAGHPLRTNSLRMRGPEIGAHKPDGSIRLLGLGDSVMFGWGVSYEQTALTMIGRRLEKLTGKPVETLNMGCPSYNTAVEVAAYRTRGKSYDPDVALLIFMENDFGFPGLMLEPVDLFTFRRSYLAERVKKWAGLRWEEAPPQEEEFISTREFDKLKKKKKGSLSSRERWIMTVRSYYERMTGREVVKARLKDFGQMLAQDGVVGVVVYNPIRLTVGQPETFEKHAGFVVEAAREAGMIGIDMTPTYEEYLRGEGAEKMRDALWVSPEDWHPNAAAHAMIAEQVTQALRSDERFRRFPEERSGP